MYFGTHIKKVQSIIWVIFFFSLGSLMQIRAGRFHYIPL
jgi:hypothetical protein